MNRLEQIEELTETIGYLECILKSNNRKYKIAALRNACLCIKNVLTDNITYNLILDYYKNITIGDCFFGKKYVNYLIELVKIELDKLEIID